jgi:hypothetical protein
LGLRAGPRNPGDSSYPSEGTRVIGGSKTDSLIVSARRPARP